MIRLPNYIKEIISKPKKNKQENISAVVLKKKINL